jgi:phytoene dehydrogenase-like protein
MIRLHHDSHISPALLSGLGLAFRAMAKKRVLVVGAGPAGLAAAVALLEEGRGSVDVRVVHMGHHLGGKAASYVNAAGEHIEHGWHMVLGFYSRMRGLLARAGVDFDRTFSSMRGLGNSYETWDDQVHRVDGSGASLAVAVRFAGYRGMPSADLANYLKFMAHAYGVASSGEDLRRHDDICFDAWAQERGLRAHVTRYSLFRMMREAYFNFPEQIRALEHRGRHHRLRRPRGGIRAMVRRAHRGPHARVSEPRSPRERHEGRSLVVRVSSQPSQSRTPSPMRARHRTLSSGSSENAVPEPLSRR